MTICLNLILPASCFNCKTPLGLTSSLFLSLKSIWTMQIFQKKMFLLNHMTMNFFLSQELDTPSDNPSYLESHICKHLCQSDPFFTHATNLGLTFALSHFMAQHIYEDLNPTDSTSTVPIFTTAYNGHMLNPDCTHNPFASLVDPNKSFSSLVCPCWGALIARIS